jgi:hypothetical protein
LWHQTQKHLTAEIAEGNTQSENKPGLKPDHNEAMEDELFRGGFSVLGGYEVLDG